MKLLVALVGLIACAAPAAPRPQPAAAPVVERDPEPAVELDTTREPQFGRILMVEVVGATHVLTIGLGTKHGVRAGWVGEVLDGSSDTALPGGTLEVVRIEQQQTLARSSLPVVQLNANPHVRLQPPP